MIQPIDILFRACRMFLVMSLCLTYLTILQAQSKDRAGERVAITETKIESLERTTTKLQDSVEKLTVNHEKRLTSLEELQKGMDWKLNMILTCLVGIVVETLWGYRKVINFKKP